MPTLRTLLPVVAAMLPVVQGFGGGKSTVFIPCNSDNDPRGVAKWGSPSI